MTPIYLDYNSTTPLDPRVFEKMRPYFETHFGNPSSGSHQWGWAADSAVKKARSEVALLLNAKDSEIIFTASASESNNMAIFGLIHQLRQEDPSAKIHLLATAVEHSSVAQVFEYAQRFYQVDFDYVPVNHQGLVDPKEIENRILPHTRMISINWVQNEIGTIQPIAEIAKIARREKIYLHVDATQAVGKIPVDVEASGVDLLSFSGHKLYGPKGVGVLFLRSQNPKVQIQGLIFGGGQEKNLRAGTLNVPGVVGLGEAAKIARENLASEKKQQEGLRNQLWRGLESRIPDVQLNGLPLKDERHSPTTLSVTFKGHSPEKMSSFLPSLGVSRGSACHSGTWYSSPTLKAIGLNDSDAQSTLRLSLGRFTTAEEIEAAIDLLAKATGNQ